MEGNSTKIKNHQAPPHPRWPQPAGQEAKGPLAPGCQAGQADCAVTRANWTTHSVATAATDGSQRAGFSQSSGPLGTRDRTPLGTERRPQPSALLRLLRAGSGVGPRDGQQGSGPGRP